MRKTVVNEFTIGESLEWTKSFCDYPAGDGWTLKYYFRGAGPGFDVDGVPDGDDFTLSVPGTTTASCAAGKYFFQAFAENGAESFLVDKGEVNILQGFGAIDAGDVYDGRSDIKKTLDAIDARIKGDVSKGVMEYTIQDRQLRHYSLKELIDLRKTYAGLFAQELRAENAKNGGGILKNHYVKFKNPR